MDENKEVLTPEQDTENTTNSDADTVTEILNSGEAETTEATEETVYQEADNDLSDTADAQPQKKKRLLQFPIIISIIIVAVAVISLLVYKGFFDKSLTGSWATKVQAESATADEATNDESDEELQYWVFDNDGKLKVSMGSVYYVYNYETSVSEEGENQLMVSFNGSESVFTYKIEGNFFIGKKLTLSNSYGAEDIKLESKSYKEPDLKHDDNFKPNDKLIGTWSYNNGFSQMSYTFNEDGTMQMNQMDMIFVDGVYTYTDNTIEIKYLTNTESYMDLSYTVEENGLNINNILFEKVTEESKTTTQAVAAESK